MKRRILSVFTMLCLIAVFESCEKEEAAPLNSPQEQSTASENTTKSKSLNNKTLDEFPEDYWDGIDAFIFNTLNGDEQGHSLEANKALHYIESTIDFQFTGDEDNIVEKRKAGEELIYEVEASFDEETESWTLSSQDMSSLGAQIHSDISEQAGLLAASSEQSVLVDVIDLDWKSFSSDGATTLTVNTYLGVINNNIAPPTNCSLVDAKVKLSQRCNGTPARSSSEEIDFYLRPLCGYWNRKLNCVGSNKIVLNPRTDIFNGLTPCGSYVDGLLPWGSCRSAADNQADFNQTRNVWNNQCFPTFSNRYIRSAGYGAWINSGHSWSNQHAIFNTATGCRTICYLPLGCPPIHRPFPIFI